MTILLDGQKVGGKSLKVTANLRIGSEDLSGQTSNTESSHTGFKPKELSVSLLIPYREGSHLTALVSLAEATSDGGQLKTYRIVNDTAEAFGVRQVRFGERLSVREDDKLSAWQVQFSLAESLSNPERVETRRPAKPVQKQESGGSEVLDPTAAAGREPEPGTPERSGFESVLERLDEYIGPNL